MSVLTYLIDPNGFRHSYHAEVEVMSFENESPVDPLPRAWLKAAAVGGAALAAGSLALAPAGFARGQGTAQTLRIGYPKYGPLVLLQVRGTLEKRLGAPWMSVSWLEFPAGPQLRGRPTAWAP